MVKDKKIPKETKIVKDFFFWESHLFEVAGKETLT